MVNWQKCLLQSIAHGVAGCALFFSIGCAELNHIAQQVDLDQVMQSLEPSSSEINSGLKAALNQGVQHSVSRLSQSGGYFNDPVSKIAFPHEAELVASTLQKFGLGSLVDEFEKRLNQGAEKGVEKALPIFSNAVRHMTFDDVKAILLGNDTAATDYFRRSSTEQLVKAFSPEIKSALSAVKADKYWQQITERYNAIPLMTKKVNTDLVAYTTERAVEGLFLKIAEEEKKIRVNPAERSSQLLKRVFGYADRQGRQN